MSEEKRKFKRLVFKTDDNVKGKIALPNIEDDAVYVEILNMSQSGIGLTFKANRPLEIAAGDHVVLEEITGIDDLKSISKTKAEIKWTLAYHPQRGMVVGSEFTDISQSNKNKIQQFVDSWFQKKMEDLKK